MECLANFFLAFVVPLKSGLITSYPDPESSNLDHTYCFINKLFQLTSNPRMSASVSKHCKKSCVLFDVLFLRLALQNAVLYSTNHFEKLSRIHRKQYTKT